MDIEDILQRGQQQVAKAEDLRQLDDVRVGFLGKKGELTALLKQLGTLDAAERPKVGALINQAKVTLQQDIEGRKDQLQQQAITLRNLLSFRLRVSTTSRTWWRWLVEHAPLGMPLLTINDLERVQTEMTW